ncbi:MAG: N-acetyltransferase family protein [Cyanobacteria bacterium J06642_2]
MIRSAEFSDVAAIASIYNHYIENTVVTFEETPVSSAEIRARLETIKDFDFPWLVAEEEGRVIGYAYAARWKERIAYRYSAEVTIYLSPDSTSKGLGTQLYRSLFNSIRKDVHVLIGVITLPNPASVAIHEKFGMIKVAHFQEVGYKFGQWLDVGCWQKIVA